MLGDRGMASPAGAQGPSTDVCVEPARARIPTSDQQESKRKIKYWHACWASLVSAFPISISRLMMMLSCRGWAVMPATLYDPTRPWLY